MRYRISFLTGLAAVALLAVPALAAEFQYKTAAQTVAAVSALKGGIATSYLTKQDDYMVELVMRDQSGQVETHANFVDHMVILDGEGTLTVGGKVVGDKQTAPGEMRGVSITGGKTYRLARDVAVTIPAGTPHWTQLAPGAHLRLVVFKTKD